VHLGTVVYGICTYLKSTVINTVEENQPLYGILLHHKNKGHPEGWPVP
jgi:hypothetical protein